MVWCTGVSFGRGMVAMGVAEVTTLHIIGIREPELSPSLEVESSSLGNSLRMACNDGDPLWAMPPTTVLE
jgi:hypothetical protein